MDFDSTILTALAAVALFILQQTLKANKTALLREVEGLVQQAEVIIQGSGLGALKKRWVIDQLEAAGVRVTGWLSKQIDDVVKALNARSAWLADQIRQPDGKQ